MKNNKIYILLLILSFVITGCLKDLRESDFSDENLSTKIKIEVKLPQNYQYSLEGLIIRLTDPGTGRMFEGVSNSSGVAEISVAHGTYIATTEFKQNEAGGIIYIFNGTTDQIKATPSDGKLITKELPLNVSKAGQIIIKELYYGGCVDPSNNKKYAKDQYVILYNNSADVAYLDSLCIGVADPWNALTNGRISHWVKPESTELRDSVPNIGIGWMFPGSGRDHALQPGEEVVISINGINHSATVPTSVDLSKPGYWALYDPILTSSHTTPEPGVKLIEGFWKVGLSNTYIISQLSPAVFIYSLGGKSTQEFVNDTYTYNPRYTNRNFDVLMVDKDLVMDGVECFRSSTDTKRFRPEIDNGFVLIDGVGQGQSAHRRVDEAATAAAGGRIVYMDTNNSTNDFEIRTTASLLNK